MQTKRTFSVVLFFFFLFSNTESIASANKKNIVLATAGTGALALGVGFWCLESRGPFKKKKFKPSARLKSIKTKRRKKKRKKEEKTDVEALDEFFCDDDKNEKHQGFYGTLKNVSFMFSVNFYGHLVNSLLSEEK